MGEKLNLEENFDEYKAITLVIIEAVKAEEYERLDELFQKRQLILDNIIKLNCLKEELKKKYLQFEIEKLDKILTSEINVRKDDLLEKIKENNKRQGAMKGYNNLSTRAVFLSKEF